MKFDPDWVLECVESAPSEFDLVARNPERTVHLGGRHMVFSPPRARRSCARATTGARRRWPTSRTCAASARRTTSWTRRAASAASPATAPLDSRHLDMLLAVQTLTDKPYMGAVITEGAAVDTIAMTDILFGGPADDPVRGVRRRERELAHALRHAHDRGDDRLRGRRAGRDHHAVPAHGRDVAGVGAGVARPADRRGAGRPRPQPGGASRRAGGAGVVPLAYRHAVGLARVRRPRVGDGPALLRPDGAPTRACRGGRAAAS